MKKFIQYMAVAACAVATLSSCKPELDLNNPAEVSTDTYYKNAKQVKSALVPAYQALVSRGQGGYVFTTLFTLLAPGDDYKRTYKWATMYQDTYNTPSGDDAAKGPWRDFFNGVFASNLAIEKISGYEGKDMTPEEKNSLLGQAYFLRGLHYMHLATLYGETVPFYDHATNSQEDYYPKNAEKGQVVDQIINDFQKASELLPAKSSMYKDADNIGRATQGAALGYLAKALLWKPIMTQSNCEVDYARAAAALKKVIDSGEYQLNPNFHDNFTNDPAKENGVESVFEIQMHTGNTWMGGDLCDSWRWINIGLPDGTGGCWWNLAPTPKAAAEFENGDPRKFMTLWCEGGADFTTVKGEKVTFADMKAKLTADKDLMGTRKECPDVEITNTNSDFNDPLMRYADILLMYAECLHFQGKDGSNVNDQSGAKYWIQQVRNRANNVVPTEQSKLWYSHDPGTIPNVDDLLAAAPDINGFKMDNVMNLIEHERCVELMGEYYRYFDLMRWGMKDAKYLEPLKKEGWTVEKMYLPFPQAELDNNPNLKGNSAN